MLLGSKRSFAHGYDENWCLEQAERWAHADPTIVVLCGKEWDRTLALACPHCGAVFFGYRPVGSRWPPYDDPRANSALTRGFRQTCGDPRCFEAELAASRLKDEECYRQSKEYYAERDKEKSKSGGDAFKPKTLQGVKKAAGG